MLETKRVSCVMLKTTCNDEGNGAERCCVRCVKECGCALVSVSGIVGER